MVAARQRTLEAVSKDHPEVAGLWLRHLRNTFKTRLLDAGVNTTAVKILMGHAMAVDESAAPGAGRI